MEYAILKLKEERNKLIRSKGVSSLSRRRDTFEIERESLRIQREIDELTKAILVLHKEMRIEEQLEKENLK
ncbi:hypothetical protein CHH83_02240 [Bacillus sp. 7586-K]|nr:hypothetical protein CHH83_02240 [Bacillus sp. 7586-K]